MEQILELVGQQKPVSEFLLASWCSQQNRPAIYIPSSIVVEYALPAWRLVPSCRNVEELRAQRQHRPLLSWLARQPRADFAFALLSNADEQRCAVLFDRVERRAELINSLDDMVPDTLSEELQKALLWLGRLLLNRVFLLWSATPKFIEEPWRSAVIIMYYVCLRLSLNYARLRAAREVFDKGVEGFLKEFS
jgi:hypothetical protein